MSPKRAKAKLLIAERALRDIADIEAYSVAQWGRRTASKYISAIEAALGRIQDDSDLLRPEAEFHPSLRFYQVNQHLLVCDVQAEAIFLLTVIHASRDIPSRLLDMQPALAAETEMLHVKLSQASE